ncbi:cyd operon YbgE family protein [Methylophaga sp.]|uniref:cyd operon YbgE family protein n=1 Tax=Methylophaga sp. TaxID=2024840 RepID=UPI003F6A2AAA
MINAWLNAPATRLLSLLFAIGLSGIILVYPLGLIRADGSSHHGLLMILLVAIGIGFIHGVGFAPEQALWRVVLSPVFAWPPMLFGIVTLLTP